MPKFLKIFLKTKPIMERLTTIPRRKMFRKKINGSYSKEYQNG